MAHMIDTTVRLSAEETARFEAWAAKRGYTVKKEGDRYCQVVVNVLREAWIEARKGAK